MLGGITKIYKMNDYLNIETSLKNGVSSIKTNVVNEHQSVYRPSVDNGKYKLDMIV